MIGFRIQEVRKQRGLSQAALATLVGVQQPSVSEWEKGRSEPAMANLATLAVVLGVTFEWLATGRGERDYAQHLSLAEPAPPEYQLRPELREWMELFGKLSARRRQAVLALIQSFQSN